MQLSPLALSDPKPALTRTVFIGDVHGCLEELLLLMKKLDPLITADSHSTPVKPRVIFLGDLIGRGPHSKEVVAWISHHHHVSLLGNHEWHYLCALNDFTPITHLAPPPSPPPIPPVRPNLTHDAKTERTGHFKPEAQTKTTARARDTKTDIAIEHLLKDYPTPPLRQHPQALRLLQEYQTLKEALGTSLHRFIKSFPLYLIEKNFIAVHGGLHPNLTLAQCPPAFIVNVREIAGRPWHSYYTGARPVFYGHWAKQGLLIKPNSIGLDSGCVYGGKLSAYILETQTLIQVDALKRYTATQT